MKGLVNELFFLRAIACLSIVFIHAINVSFENLGIRKDPDFLLVNSILFAIQILLMFGTPMFVFISEFLLAYSYKNKMPKGFMKKRLKYILIPYISMGIFYSVVRAVEQGINSVDTILSMTARIIFLGDFHGYFILIIFQFYFLHYIFIKYIEKFNAKYVIMLSLVINVLYLGFFNFQSPPQYFEGFYWNFITKIPFLAWISYFVIAFYCGRNLDEFKLILKKYKKFIVTAPFIMGGIVLLMCYSKILTPIHSKRVDILFYTISVAFFLFYIAMKLKRVPNIFMLVSSYSFGIYLLHPFFQEILKKIAPQNYSFINLMLNIILYFTLGVCIPIILTYLLNKTKVGPLLVGKTGIRTNKDKKALDKVS